MPHEAYDVGDLYHECLDHQAVDNIMHCSELTKLQARVAELKAAIQAWNDATDLDEHTKAVKVLQGMAKG